MDQTPIIVLIFVGVIAYAFWRRRQASATLIVNGERVTTKVDAFTAEMMRATGNWSLPLVMRAYDSNAKGDALFQRESVVLTQHGYDASNLSEEGGHIHAGRLILTGGLSVLAGKKGIRSGGKRTVVWKKLVK